VDEETTDVPGIAIRRLAPDEGANALYGNAAGGSEGVVQWTFSYADD
jgi:hypothetical protein